MDADSNNSATDRGSTDGAPSSDASPTRPFWIKSITFSDGTNLPVPSSGVVVFVGPNNVGKSQALRDIYLHLTGAISTITEEQREGHEHRAGPRNVSGCCATPWTCRSGLAFGSAEQVIDESILAVSNRDPEEQAVAQSVLVGRITGLGRRGSRCMLERQSHPTSTTTSAWTALWCRCQLYCAAPPARGGAPTHETRLMADLLSGTRGRCAGTPRCGK